jgi:hypothetical protein
MKQIAIVMALAGLTTTAYFLFGVYAQAQSDSEEQVTIVQAVEALTAIHVRQATVAEAEAQMLERLCREGSLDVTHCPALVVPMMLPAVSAAPPTGETE